MKTMRVAVAGAVLWVGMLVLIAGCQAPGKLVSVQESSACPMCKMETRTTPITGVTYAKCVCPHCRNVTQLDPNVPDAVRAYVGPDIGNTVHVCDHCEAIAADCPVCRKAGK